MRKITKNEFIERSNIIHGNKYNYDNVEYIDRVTNVNIICPIHGEFQQTPAAHLQGQGCPKCGIEKIRNYRLLSLDEFIKRANEVHNNKYDYTKVIYNGLAKPITIMCPIHGEFSQTPRDHLDGYGCHKCSGWHVNKTPVNNEEFIRKAQQIHGNKYNYSKTDLNNRDENGKVCIICPKHGEFKQKPLRHLYGSGCRKCADELHADKKRSNNSEFIRKSKEINGDKYDYSKVKYVNDKTPIVLICPIHGEFEQTPNNHLTKFAGCPACNESKLEKTVGSELLNYDIKHKRGKRFKWLRGMHLDFYLLDYNIGIECQGIQHFVEKQFFEPLNKIQERDKRKKQLCEENGVKLIYYLNKEHNEYMNKDDIYFNDVEKLIEYLRKLKNVKN